MDVNDKSENVGILDTAGQSEYHPLYDHWIRDYDNFILVYDIASRRSFKHIDYVCKRIMRAKDDDIAFNLIVVGNKCDLYDKCDLNQIRMKLTRENIIQLVYGYIAQFEHKSNLQIIPVEIKQVCLKYHGETLNTNVEVTYEMGQEFATSLESEYFKVPFFETSAKTGENVRQMFQRMVMLCQSAISDDNYVQT